MRKEKSVRIPLVCSFTKSYGNAFTFDSMRLTLAHKNRYKFIFQACYFHLAQFVHIRAYGRATERNIVSMINKQTQTNGDSIRIESSPWTPFSILISNSIRHAFVRYSLSHYIHSKLLQTTTTSRACIYSNSSRHSIKTLFFRSAFCLHSFGRCEL